MTVTAADDNTVEAAFELLEEVFKTESEESRPHNRVQIKAAFLRYFPEYEAEINQYFQDLEKSCEDAEVVAARLQREYWESRWT